ncbi:FecR family protein [Puia sp.]|uniref:FecR family protein n=1 Tax=Puia sp. TaxID=2045100 RepID=UPI002F40873B
MSEITRELLAKFWMGLCTEEEATLVEAYFEEHPGDESLHEEFAVADDGPIAEEDRVAMLENVLRVTRPRRTGFISRAGMVMAAASLLIVCVAVWIYHKGGQRVPEGRAPREAVLWTGKHNADSRSVRVMLPDSSEAVLSPGATVRYRKDFGSYEKREIKFEGRAVFSVRRDEQQPFIVYSEGIRTTVLGTIFEVSNEGGSDEIRVKLLQGKIVVGMDSVAGDPAKQYFLAPGEEFVYGKATRSIAVHRFRTDPPIAVRRAKHPAGKPDSLANWYMFNNQELADVFDQLAILYNVEIQYSSTDLHNKYFIGKLETRDSLRKIMRDIALLNHLNIVEQDGGYIVRKQP